MSSRVLPAQRKTLVTGGNPSGTPAAEPTAYAFTGWIPTNGITSARALLQLTQPTAKFQAQAAYQLAATDTSSPGTWTAFGSALTTQDRTTAEVDLTTPISGDFWIRFGVIATNTNTAYSYERGDVTLSVGVSD